MTRCRSSQRDGSGKSSSAATARDLCLDELAAIVGGELRLGSMPPLGGKCEPVDRITFAAHEAGPRDVFWELPQNNGSQRPRAEQAFSHGALAAVVARKGVEPWAGRSVIEVKDANQSLWQIASSMREHYAGKVIAVAGRLGKSTTCAMIAHVLREYLASVTAVDDDAESPVLRTLVQLQSQADCALVELPGDASEATVSLARLARPHLLVLLGNRWPTTAPCNESTASAAGKWSELLGAIPRDGLAIVDGDDPALCRAAADRRGRTLLVGRGSHCDVLVRNVDGSGTVLSLQADGVRLRLPVWGRHHVSLAAAALAACRALGAPDRHIVAALAEFAAPAGRCRVVAHRPVTVIDDTFRAGALDTRAALAALRDTPTDSRRIVVLGPIDMRGDDLGSQHRTIGEMVVTLAGAGTLVACGPHAEAIALGARGAGMRDEAALLCRSADEALSAVRSMLRTGDVVLVKGHRHFGMEKIAGAIADATITDTSQQPAPLSRRPRTAVHALTHTHIVEALPFAPVMREAGATLPPG